MDTKEYLNILKTEVNKKSIKKDSTQILQETPSLQTIDKLISDSKGIRQTMSQIEKGSPEWVRLNSIRKSIRNQLDKFLKVHIRKPAEQQYSIKDLSGLVRH
jgi:hypothetical protein